MKKILIALLSLAMLFSFAACDNSSNTPDDADDPTIEEPTTDAYVGEDVESAVKNLFTTTDGFDDKGFEAIPENEMANTYEFYLRNADGDYIVATKWNGEGAAEHQALYGFTTVPADKLNHHLQRVYSGLDKTQLYFGEFRASGAEEILSLDATKLIAIEKLEVNIDPVDAAWTSAVVGRYDFAGTPTLVASQGTLLKPILITLGSDDVVDIKDFILNGKFVTVVRNNVSETSKAKEGFIVADGVKTSDWNPATDIVASYGNPLEGQWAVTYKDGNYVFTNRENTNVYFTLTASNLYTTTTDRVYRQGNFTYEIKGVAEHAATDGYKRGTEGSGKGRPSDRRSLFSDL